MEAERFGEVDVEAVICTRGERVSERSKGRRSQGRPEGGKWCAEERAGERGWPGEGKENAPMRTI